MYPRNRIYENILDIKQVERLEKKGLEPEFISMIHLIMAKIPEEQNKEFYDNFIAALPKGFNKLHYKNKEFRSAIKQARDNIDTTQRLIKSMEKSDIESRYFGDLV